MSDLHHARRRPPLRLWPGIVAVSALWIARFGIKEVVPGFQGFSYGMMGSFAGASAVILWWTFFSRASRLERFIGVPLMVLALAASFRLGHETMSVVWLVAYAVPVMCLAFVTWAVATRRLPDPVRRTTMIATIAAAAGVWTLFQTSGINGDHDAEFSWRWRVNAERQLLASTDTTQPAPSSPTSLALAPTAALPATPAETAPAAASEAPPFEGTTASVDTTRPAARPQPQWPSFRGADRDGVVRGSRIATDWSRTPPVEIWRRPIGPGWSSFAVGGDRFYTQEQRGEDEIVACYRTDNGLPVWTHRDPARFFESNGGAGPRATPTLDGDRVFAFGATGILNALDIDSGRAVWSRNVSRETGVPIPSWGFSSSPLVLDDLVIVAAAGQLVAYERATGVRRWVGPDGGGGYSSPHLVTFDGVPQVVLLSDGGAVAVAPTDGTVLWQHAWPGSSIVQPALAADRDLLISHIDAGTRRIAVGHGAQGWTTEERWTTNALKPYFNDFVIHKGHAYGFDGRILAAVDVADGRRKWKGGRYGNGQLVLLPDQDLLLVLSEEGELALVSATPDQFKEIAHSLALNGKTWNHPVIVNDLLLVRNGEEMVAFRLAPIDR